MLQYDYKLQMHRKLTQSDHEILIMCKNNIISIRVCLHSSVNSQLQSHQVRLREAVFFPTTEQNYQTLNDSIDMEESLQAVSNSSTEWKMWKTKIIGGLTYSSSK